MRKTIETHFEGNYREFYGRYLPKVRKIGGNEYQTLCPFHEDKNPSFSFNSQTGKYFCYGCGRKGHALHFYGKIHNLDTKRDFPKILRGIAHDFGIPWEEQKKRIVKTYDYTDCEGNLLFQVCRMEPKDFRQRRPDGNGGWKWDLKGIEPILYNLPEVTKIQEVLLVEGEKDVETAAKLGFVATTSPMGAGKWRDHYNASLKGKDLVLIPDNDEEGRRHMMGVAASLNGTSNSLKWIDLPGIPSKGDLTDWVATFADPEAAAERLAVMIEGAPLYEPPKKRTIEDLAMPVSVILSLVIAERRTILNPWLKLESINLVSGWRGLGKTWAALGISDAVSKGEAFGPWKADEPFSCLFVDGEMPIFDLRERLQALGCDSPRLHVYSDYLANQWGLPRAHLGNESWREKMTGLLKARKIKLFVLDNIGSLASGLDENSKKDWDPINGWLLELRFSGISTILLHHVGKEGSQRGTSAREDNLDSSLILRQPGDYVPEQGARFIVHFSKARIPTRDLPLIADTEFQLTQDREGKALWTWNNVRKQPTAEVLTMLDEGMTYDVIMATLGISKGRISQIKSAAIKAGHLSAKGKLTQSGFMAIQRDEK